MIPALGFSSSFLSAKMRVVAYWAAWALLLGSLAFVGAVTVYL